MKKKGSLRNSDNVMDRRKLDLRNNTGYVKLLFYRSNATKNQTVHLTGVQFL